MGRVEKVSKEWTAKVEKLHVQFGHTGKECAIRKREAMVKEESMRKQSSPSLPTTSQYHHCPVTAF